MYFWKGAGVGLSMSDSLINDSNQRRATGEGDVNYSLGTPTYIQEKTQKVREQKPCNTGDVAND